MSFYYKTRLVAMHTLIVTVSNSSIHLTNTCYFLRKLLVFQCHRLLFVLYLVSLFLYYEKKNCNEILVNFAHRYVIIM